MIFGRPQIFTPWFTFDLQGYCDFERTYVSKKSVLRMFGYSGSAGWLSEYLQTFRKFTIIPENLVSAIENPILIEVANGKKTIIEEVYDVEIVMGLCQFILHAKEEGFIGLLDLKIANTAQTVLSDNEIIPLGDAIAETTGRNFYKSRIKEKTSMLLFDATLDASFNWLNAIPNDWIERLFILRKLDWEMGDELTPDLAYLIRSFLFNRLPEALHTELMRLKPKRSYRRTNHREQTIGNPNFEEVLIIINGLIRASGYSEAVLGQLLDRIYPTRADVGEIVPIEVPQLLLSAEESEIKSLIFT